MTCSQRKANACLLVVSSVIHMHWASVNQSSFRLIGWHDSHISDVWAPNNIAIVFGWICLDYSLSVTSYLTLKAFCVPMCFVTGVQKTAKLALRWKWSKCQYKFHVCGKKSLLVFQPSPKYWPQGWVCHVWSHKFLPPYCILYSYACVTWLYHVWLSASRMN